MLDWIVSLLDKAGVPYREMYYEGDKLIRHYFLPDGLVLEVVLRKLER